MLVWLIPQAHEVGEETDYDNNGGGIALHSLKRRGQSEHTKEKGLAGVLVALTESPTIPPPREAEDLRRREWF